MMMFKSEALCTPSQYKFSCCCCWHGSISGTNPCESVGGTFQIFSHQLLLNNSLQQLSFSSFSSTFPFSKCKFGQIYVQSQLFLIFQKGISQILPDLHFSRIFSFVSFLVEEELFEPKLVFNKANTWQPQLLRPC